MKTKKARENLNKKRTRIDSRSLRLSSGYVPVCTGVRLVACVFGPSSGDRIETKKGQKSVVCLCVQAEKGWLSKWAERLSTILFPPINYNRTSVSTSLVVVLVVHPLSERSGFSAIRAISKRFYGGRSALYSLLSHVLHASAYFGFAIMFGNRLTWKVFVNGMIFAKTFSFFLIPRYSFL